MRATVVIRSKDEAARLRLVLASLVAQKRDDEVVVVNDGSTDETAGVLASFANVLPLTVIEHAAARGRSAASNAGAAAATGDVLVFIDGDTLAGPQFVARHLEVHRGHAGIMARGETYHIRQANVARVTESLVRDAFPQIDALASPGIYPGAASRRLYELEMQALHEHPDSPILWAAASGSNFSVPRVAFLEAGGFNEELDFNEHRELALRLYERGMRMLPAQARSYHLISGPRRDPLTDTGWQRVFYRAHPIPEVKQLCALWASLVEGRHVGSLTELESAGSRC